MGIRVLATNDMIIVRDGIGFLSRGIGRKIRRERTKRGKWKGNTWTKEPNLNDLKMDQECRLSYYFNLTSLLKKPVPCSYRNLIHEKM